MLDGSGVHKPDTDLVTSHLLGCFRENMQLRQELLGKIS
jgi:GTP cyclohydrolase I